MSVFRHVLILHSNPPTHEPKFVKYFLKSEKVTVLPQPPYSPDLATCDFFFFFVVVSGRDYKSRQSLGSAIVQCISGQPKSASREAFQKWIQRLKSWISNRGENFEGCNVYLIWMLFEISYNTHYKSNNPRIHKFILNDTLLIYITVAWIYSTWPKKN